MTVGVSGPGLCIDEVLSAGRMDIGVPGEQPGARHNHGWTAEMAHYDVVGDVSAIIVQMLTDAFADQQPVPPVVELNDLSDAVSTLETRLTVFLCDISKDPASRNRPPVRPAGAGNCAMRTSAYRSCELGWRIMTANCPKLRVVR